MQNVIEQSVLDNNWLPTAESTGSTAHRASPLSTLAALSVLPHLNSLIYSSIQALYSIVASNKYKKLQKEAR